MSAPVQNRQPPGRPTGGEYAPTVHAEPDVQLEPEYRHATIPVGSLKVSNYSYRNEPMPSWPESLPEPKPYFVLEDGTPRVTLEVEGLPEVSFWTSDIDGVCSSFDNGDEEWPEVDDEVIEEVEEYGAELCNRVSAHVYGITIEACQAPGVQKAILDDAMGREPEPEPERSPRDRSLEQAERAMSAISTAGDGVETDLGDLLANLRHYADKHGIDFDAVDEKARGYYDSDLDDPSFDTAY